MLVRPISPELCFSRPFEDPMFLASEFHSENHLFCRAGEVDLLAARTAETASTVCKKVAALQLTFEAVYRQLRRLLTHLEANCHGG